MTIGAAWHPLKLRLLKQHAQKSCSCMEAVWHLGRLRLPLIVNICSSQAGHCSTSFILQILSCLPFSLYKTWGPHLAALYGSHSAFNEIKVSCLCDHVSGHIAQQKWCAGELPVCCSHRIPDSMPGRCIAGSTRDFCNSCTASPHAALFSFWPALQPLLLPPLRRPARQAPCRPVLGSCRIEKQAAAVEQPPVCA